MTCLDSDLYGRKFLAAHSCWQAIATALCSLCSHLGVGHGLVHLSPVLLSISPGHWRGEAILPPRLPLHLHTQISVKSALLTCSLSCNVSWRWVCCCRGPGTMACAAAVRRCFGAGAKQAPATLTTTTLPFPPLGRVLCSKLNVQ